MELVLRDGLLVIITASAVAHEGAGACLALLVLPMNSRQRQRNRSKLAWSWRFKTSTLGLVPTHRATCSTWEKVGDGATCKLQGMSYISHTTALGLSDRETACCYCLGFTGMVSRTRPNFPSSTVST